MGTDVLYMLVSSGHCGKMGWFVTGQAHRRNHVASRCYLDAWTDESGYLVAVRKAPRIAHRARPAAVGYRKNFWGGDPELRAAAEEAVGVVESAAAQVLRRVPDEWPLLRGSTEWFSLIQFLALHAVRTPQWLAFAERQREADIARRLDEHRQVFGERLDAFLDHLRSDRQMIELLLGQIPKMASLLGSMHVALLRFNGPMLVASDQSLAPVPLVRPGGPAAVAAVPDTGFLATEEFRFPVDPRHALLLTWLDEPDDRSPIEADFAVACDLNVATAAQADREFFHCPGRTPPFVVPPFAQLVTSPIGRRVFERYTPQAARESERRKRAGEILNRLVEDEVTDRIEVVSVTRAA